MKSQSNSIRSLIITSATALMVLAAQEAHSWIPLPKGVFGDWAILQHGPIAAKDGVLYAVYYSANHTPSIRRYDTCSDSWGTQELTSASVGGRIDALAVNGDYLYVGGYFTSIAGISATNVAKFHIPTSSWSPLGNNSLTNKVVTGIAALSPTDVYVILVTGPYDEFGTGVDAELVKHWDGTAWGTVGQGIWAYGLAGGSYAMSVDAITTDGTNIYVGGAFSGGTSSNGDGVLSYNIIRWKPASGVWEPISALCNDPYPPTPPVPPYPHNVCDPHVLLGDMAIGTTVVPPINALACSGGYLFIAGGFAANDIDYMCYTDDPIAGAPRCIYSLDEGFNYARGLVQMPVNGPFWNVGPYLSRYNGSSYYAGAGFCLATFGGNTWVGGYFDSLSSLPNTASSVAQLTHSSGPVIESGLTVAQQASFGVPDRLAVDQYAVYVVGNFDTVSGVPCETSVARAPLYPFVTGDCMGKIGWWRMNGNVVDSAMDHSSSIVNSFKFATGKYGFGIQTSGNPGGLSVEDAAALNFGTSGSGSDFTLEAWVKPGNATTSYDILNIIDKRVVSGTVTGYEFGLSGGKPFLQMSAGGQLLTAGPVGNDLRNGSWHHVAVTVQRNSSTGIKLYVDGAQVGLSFNPTTVSSDLTTTAPLLIGLHPDATLDCNFRGVMDEAGIYRRALTSLEISGIYNSGKQCSGCLPADAVAWWPMEENGIDIVGRHDGAIKQTFEFQPDQTGQYAQLNGKAGGINVTDTSDLNFGTGSDFTIEAWVKPSNASTSFEVMDIVDKRITSGTVTGYELALSSGKLIFQLASNGQILNSGPYGNDLRDGNWHHVAVTVQRNSSTGGKLYVDGAQIGTSFNPTSVSGSITCTAALLIGMHPDTSLDCNFRGGLDEVVLCSRALSATEIQNTYSSGPP